MKRYTAFILAAVMLLCMIPQKEAQAAADYSWVKVKLSTNNATSLTIYASGTYFIKENGVEFTGGTLTVRSNGDGTMTLSHSSLGNIYTGSSLSLMRARVDRTAGYLKLNSRSYLGHFHLKYMSSGYIRVVNEVPLAHYLYGVVGHEMSNTFPIEALKAQAVAAKCYVFSKLSMGGDYNIGDTSSEQVYKGYTASNTNVINAVDSTLSEVLTVNGSLLCTYYAASNGGETLLPSQAWPTKNVNDAGYGISIDPYDLSNPYSKKETIKIPVGIAGSISQALMNLILAKASNAAGTYVDQINGIMSVTMDSPRYPGTTRDMTKCHMQLLVSSSTGGDQMMVNISISVSEFASYGVTGDSTLRSYWGELSSDSHYYIYHVRYGHGVGMSQRGAQARANDGHSYRDILSFYYPGATISNITVAVPSDPENTVANNAPEGDSVLARTTGNVKMRSGPSTSYSSIVTVPDDSDIYVYASVDGWAYSVYDGKVGYISEKYVDYPNGRPVPQVSPTPSASPDLDLPIGAVAYGTVNGSGVNLRIGPSTSYSSIAKLPLNTELYVMGSENGWYKVQTKDGNQGYMLSTYVSITGYAAADSDADQEQEVTDPGAVVTPSASPSPTDDAVSEPAVTAYGRVTGQGVNFRAGPATSYQSLAKLDRDTVIEIYSMNGSWYYGKANGMVGFISGGYVELLDGAGNTPNVGGNISVTTPDTGGQPSYTTVSVGKLNASGVNLRVGPGTEYISLMKLSKNTGVYIFGSSGNWYSVQTGGTKGYVYDTYVTITGQEQLDTSGNVVGAETPGEGVMGKGVTTGSVRIRKGPGTGYSSLKLMPKGTEVTLYGISDGWYFLKHPDGTEGYSSSKYIKVTESYANYKPSSGQAETQNAIAIGVTTTDVNFRQGPATTTKKLDRLSEGTEVMVFGQEGSWYQVEYKGTRGYIYAKYITKTVTVTQGTGGAQPGASSGQDTTVSAEGSGSGAVTLTKGVTTANVNFRSGPNTSGTTVYETVSKGRTVEIIGQTGTWYYVIYGGRAGFMSSAYVNVSQSGTVGVQSVSSSVGPQNCITSADVNLRTGPSTSHSKITLLKKGTPLTVYYVAGEWCFVKCNGQYGYAFDEYVSLA